MDIRIFAFFCIIFYADVICEVEAECTDLDPHCQSWAKIGECKVNPCYMLLYCPLSCEDCHGEVSIGSGDCVNSRGDCPCLASRGRCEVQDIRLACKKSCEPLCGGGGRDPDQCDDDTTYCTFWADTGECDANPNYMLQFCKIACDECKATERSGFSTISTTTPTTPVFTSSRSATAVSFKGSLTMNKTYEPALDDPSSPAYISLKNDIENLVNEKLRNSSLKSAFIGSRVTEFRKGSVVADVFFDFKDEEIVTGNEQITLTNIVVEEKLKEELRKDPTQAAGLDIDVDSTVVGERHVAVSCQEILQMGHRTSGVYTIKPDPSSDPFEVACDLKTDGGGWTIFQRRLDGTVDFFREWQNYKDGFGDIHNEYWLGNEKVYQMTKTCCHELRIELGDWSDNWVYAKYSNFSVGPPSGDYVLTATGYRGTAKDGLTSQYNGHPFATKDHGQDSHCAREFKGGWWYNGCHTANLNGLYHVGGTHKSYADGVNWYPWKGYYYSLYFAEMKFRTNFCAGVTCQNDGTCVNGISSFICKCPEGFTGTLCEDVITSCQDVFQEGYRTSGVYTINPDISSDPIEVFCDLETDGGGWTVFQRRLDGTVDFFRNWQDYKDGFGDVHGEYWLGNEKLHQMTKTCCFELRIELQDWDRKWVFAKYSNFSVGSPSGDYVLTATGYSGTANDGLTSQHNGHPFATKDHGQDSHCAREFKGGWWYNGCHTANLNGLYHIGGAHTSYADGINWYPLKGYYYSLKYSEMKFRINFCAGVTCQNGGTCQGAANSFTCICTAGYSGSMCEQNIDDCVSVTCQNGGSCIDGVNSYTCQCLPGYKGSHCEQIPNSCQDLYQNGNTASGVFKIQPEPNSDPFEVFCDQETDGGGWTVFQRRQDGTVDFFRDWQDYKDGFGDKHGEYWLRNEKIHQMTKICCHELRIELEDWDNNRVYAKYSNFSVGPESGEYVLTATGYSGTANDGMNGEPHNGQPFSTKDRGQSSYCANNFKGGWWYKSCHSANLNGLYHVGGDHTSYADGINWNQWKGYQYSMKYADMKFRSNFCSTVTCQNGGTCQRDINSCICIAGYTGSQCEENIDDCDGITCQNGGTCQDGINSYTCNCVPGYTGTHCEQVPASCQDVYQNGFTVSAVYKIQPEPNSDSFKVFCDQETDGGGWTVFQRRQDGTVDFFRDWQDYKDGFGDKHGEYWLGNEKIHQMTKICCHELRIELEDWDNNRVYAKYSNFSVGPGSGEYVLTATGYSGTANDGMNGEPHNGQPFSTKDRGQSSYCANNFKGGWWYKSCHSANLNGLYHVGGDHTSYADGINWNQWKGYQYSMKYADMKFRTNLCAGVTCQNGGSCQGAINSYTCICMAGYTGSLCEQNIDDCAGVTCQNGGTCQDGVSSYTCNCVPGYTGLHCEQVPASCQDVINNGYTTSGVFAIQLGPNSEPFQVFCDQETDGGGWTVFQRRQDGTVDFFRDWQDYKDGFGDVHGEFWLGNEKIHQMTKICCHELRIDLTGWDDEHVYAKYSTFSLGGGEYVLEALGYSGTAGNGLHGQPHHGIPFSTKDHGANAHCADLYKGGWWYNGCHSANLNGLYHVGGPHESYADGINWYFWRGHKYSAKTAEMKFR